MSKLTDVPTKRQTMKRILVLLTLAIAGMVTSVTAAQAEVVSNYTVSYAYGGFVSCANGGGNLPLALTAGFQRAFLIGTGLVLAAALIALMATNTRAGRRPPLNT